MLGNARINRDGTLAVHIEIPFGCEAQVTLPRSGKAPETLPAGAYDFRYQPTKDYRKPFDGKTPLVTLSEHQEVLDVLFGLVPAIASIAKSGDPEHAYGGLEDLRKMIFIPFEPEKLEQAIEQISNLVIMP